jgi:hypothetical protein
MVIGRHVAQNILSLEGMLPRIFFHWKACYPEYSFLHYVGIGCKSQRKKERNKQTTLGGTSTHAGTMVKITKFI